MNKLREYRKRNRLSQIEFANLVGLKQPSISEYEKGRKRPGKRAAKQIAQATGIDIAYLLYGQE